MRADSSVSPGFCRRVLLVQLVQQPQPSPLLLRRAVHRRLQIDDRLAGVAERRALIGRRHVAVAPVRRAVDRPAAVIGEDDEPGQVLVLAAEAVGDPAADARMPGEDAAGVHLEQRRAVRRAQRVHRADQRDVVGVLGHVREQLRHVHAALAVLLELPRRGHQPAGRAHRPSRTSPTPVIVSPWSSAESGLGSKVSTWLTPP